MPTMSISRSLQLRKPFHSWSNKPAPERSRYLLRIADLIERDLEKSLSVRLSAFPGSKKQLDNKHVHVNLSHGGEREIPAYR